MRTQTELVCITHFSQYQHDEIVRRNTLPADISPLHDPLPGLCRVTQADDELRLGHSAIILAVTWIIE